MAKYAIIKTFLASDLWNKFRLNLIAERGNKCQKCGVAVVPSFKLHGHHIIELTPENVRDYSISLNPDNVLLICRDCHDKEHGRFGYAPIKEVYIVYGPPMSGKSSYVQEYMGRGDLVVDIDRLYHAVSMLPEYDKPDNLLSNVRAIHNLLVDNIKTRYGKWANAWIVGGYADKHKREKLAEDLGAELVFCDVAKEECLRRLEADEARRYRKDEWQGYITRWFADYTA